MATRRTNIVNSYVSKLKTITELGGFNVFREYKYLDEVNDFPTITLLPQAEQRIGFGDGRKLARLDIVIRGYVQSEDTSLELAEALGANIESATNEFRFEQQANGVADARVVSFKTDEGLFDPYGIADQQVQILYEVEANL
jgi:hypothetical protein